MSSSSGRLARLPGVRQPENTNPGPEPQDARRSQIRKAPPLPTGRGLSVSAWGSEGSWCRSRRVELCPEGQPLRNGLAGRVRRCAALFPARRPTTTSPARPELKSRSAPGKGVVTTGVGTLKENVNTDQCRRARKLHFTTRPMEGDGRSFRGRAMQHIAGRHWPQHTGRGARDRKSSKSLTAGSASRAHL